MRIPVCALLVACGRTHASSIDAPAGDIVTLTINYAGAPVVGAHVYFQNADSSLVGETTTDATGTASGAMGPGGYVTAANSVPGGTYGRADEVDTIAGVQPGDQLQLIGEHPAHYISVQVIAPRDSNATFNHATFFSTCGAFYIDPVGTNPPSGTGQLYNCGATTDVLVTATSDNAGAPFDYFFVPDVAVGDGSTLDLTAHAYVPSTVRTYTFTNIPAQTSTIGLLMSEFSAHGELGVYQMASLTSPSWSVQLNVAAFAGGGHIVEVNPDAPTIATNFIMDWGPYASSYAMDVGARELPQLTTVATFDPRTHELAWAESNDGIPPDAVLGVVGAKRGTRTWIWQVLAPHTGPSIRFPTLPTDVFDYNIGAADVTAQRSIQLRTLPGGYDAARALPFAIGTNADGAIQGVVMGPSGASAAETLILQ